MVGKLRTNPHQRVDITDLNLRASKVTSSRKINKQMDPLEVFNNESNICWSE